MDSSRRDVGLEKIESEQVINAQETKNALEKQFIRLAPKGDTTPSVMNVERIAFQNVVPITVVAFDEGQEGQTIIVLGDGQTTVANNAKIVTSTGANTLLDTGKIYQFTRFSDGKWRQHAAGTGIGGGSDSIVRWADFIFTEEKDLVDASGTTLAIDPATLVLSITGKTGLASYHVYVSDDPTLDPLGIQNDWTFNFDLAPGDVNRIVISPITDGMRERIYYARITGYSGAGQTGTAGPFVELIAYANERISWRRTIFRYGIPVYAPSNTWLNAAEVIFPTAILLHVGIAMWKLAYRSAANYVIPLQYNETNGVWKRVIPTHENHRGDFDLEVMVSGSSAKFRVRNYTGNQFDGAALTFLSFGDDVPTFLPLFGTGTDPITPDYVGSIPEPPQLNYRYGAIELSVDNNGQPVTAFDSGWIMVPFNCVIGPNTEIVADLVGTVDVDVYKATYAAFPTFTKISNTQPIRLTAAQKAQPSTSAWTTLVLSKGDYIRMTVPINATTLSKFTASIPVTRV